MRRAALGLATPVLLSRLAYDQGVPAAGQPTSFQGPHLGLPRLRKRRRPGRGMWSFVGKRSPEGCLFAGASVCGARGRGGVEAGTSMGSVPVGNSGWNTQGWELVCSRAAWGL